MEMDKNTQLYIQGDGITATAIVGQDITVFAGAATTSAFTRTLIGQDNRLEDLYVRAINNRTRERNYFKLYSSLLRGDISDDDFDEEIDKNEDDYVVPAGVDADLTEIEFALQVTPKLKNVETTDDFMALFSFNDKSVHKYIAEND